MTPTALLLKASILLVIAALAQAAFARRTSAATRHLIWVLAIVGLLLLPVLSSVLPGWTAVRVTAPVTPAAAVVVESPEPGTRATSGTASLSATPAGAARTVPPAFDVRWAVALSLFYAAGVLLLLVRLTVERMSIHWLARRATEVNDPEWRRLLLECAERIGVRRRVWLLRSRDQTIPMAFGTWRAAIMIPAVADLWSEDRRRAVLLHELAHVARHDCATQALAAVACALYWIHPGAWWISRRLRVERELACDDCVLSTGTNARDYAGHLLELAYTLRGQRAPVLAVCMAGTRQLEGRILAVLDAARNRATPPFRSRVAGAAMMAAWLVPLAAATATVVPVGPDADEQAAFVQPSQGLPGTWEMRPTNETGIVQLRLTERDGWFKFAVGVDRLNGLSTEQLSGTHRSMQFSLKRDAGTFTFEGIFRDRVGAGTYTFAPDAGFSGALAKRGFEPPTAEDQWLLARGDIGLAFLDELTAQGYRRPHLALLVGAAQHGVSLGYVREMGRSGYRLGSVEALIAQRDHGVSPQFIRELRAEGLTDVAPDDLVRARDHGVSPEFVKALRELGYAKLSLDALIQARDHGVSPEYIRDLRELGYDFTLDELIAARDHGVSPEYVRELRELGYVELSLEELIRARDHGVSPEYIRALTAVGYQRLSLEELIRLRDHGVDADFVKVVNRVDYRRQTVDEIVILRDQGPPLERFRRAFSRIWAVNIRQLGWHFQCGYAWIQQMLDGDRAPRACTTR